MNTSIELLTMATSLLVLIGVAYLIARVPRTRVKARDRAILVDTSVLMDGRIVAVAQSGFISGTLVIPRTVVAELQLLADNADADKRARARYGLDVVKELQDMENLSVELLQDGSRTEHGVDERLLDLAKQHGAVICTIDYNLNKVAVVEGIQVLNINQLAQNLRMAYLPGDRMKIELVQKGNDAHQAVGYLADGTMVVVEQSSTMVGRTVEVEIIRSLQTAAGRMMFARRVDALKQPAPSRRTDSGGQHKQPTPRRTQKLTQPAQDKSADRTRQSAPHQPAAKRPRGPQQPQRGRRIDHEANLVNMINGGE